MANRRVVFEVFGPDGAYLTFHEILSDAIAHARAVGGTYKKGYR